MKHLNLPGLLLRFFVVWVYFLGFMVHGTKIKYEDPVLVKNPKPTHIENTYIELVKVHIISPEINDEHFMGRPIELVVDSQGNLIVYDNIVNKIFIFDKNFKFLRSILKTGQGPGEIHKGRSGIHIYLSSNDKLYISDRFNRKIIIFTSSGDYIKDIKLPLFQLKETYPVVDLENKYYFLASSSSSNSGLINVLDKEFTKLYSLVDRKEMLRIIVDKPVDKYHTLSYPSTDTVRYDIIDNNGLIAFLSQSSTAFVYKRDKLVKRFDIHPKRAIEIYRKRVERLKKKVGDAYSQMFWQFFVDKDNERFFYTGTINDDENNRLLYQFDLEGSLAAVYRTSIEGVHFLTKRHHHYYAVNFTDDHIYIFKESKK
ncbi:MAG: 6-bladed beta-propeller [Candidatus Aminicenantes bacterium]|jgi:hypothetical protein